MIRASNDLLNRVQSATESTAPPSVLPGYRLARLEVYNWGTFDSPHGNVHVIPVDGQTALLVGHNETGKSTLVDALLTLLVRPGIGRNYNVAAGAGKGERTERTYIRGAFERRSRDDARSEITYLRAAHGYYSALLACFRDDSSGTVFTVAVILYLTADNAVEKLYCFAPKDRSIAGHCAGIRSLDRLARQMQEKGFAKTTKSYAEYFEWIRKATGIRPQAMDMFNQTVAVKDIQRLNDFIRKHMLETKPWGAKVDELLRHFQDLSDAHRDLLRVQKQHSLLLPVETHGAQYRDLADRQQIIDRLLSAADSYFNHKIIPLFTAECEAKRAALAALQTRKIEIASSIKEALDQCRRLQNEIDQAGGERLRRIPDLINGHQIAEQAKSDKNRTYQDALSVLGIKKPTDTEAQFLKIRLALPALATKVQQSLADAEEKRHALILERGDKLRTVAEDEAELKFLQGRRENLPARFGDMRRQLCSHLRLKEVDLPFVAELVAVRENDRPWEASIEMLLRGFAQTLLVPESFYPVVSAYIERTPLRDARGIGQKLGYNRVHESSAGGPAAWADESVLNKIEFRPGHRLLPWLKAELRSRFDYRCCDTVRDFQASREKALTKERHVKHAAGRHEKDDREQFTDRRHYVLGWDNREKRRSLEMNIRSLRESITTLDAQLERYELRQDRLREQARAIETALSVTDFAHIDFQAIRREIEALRREKKALEENNDAVRTLKKRHAAFEQQAQEREERREKVIREMERLDGDIQTGSRMIANAKKAIAQSKTTGALASLEKSYPEITRYFVSDILTWENVVEKRDEFVRSRRAERDDTQRQIEPVRSDVQKCMTAYLRAFPDEKSDLSADVAFLADFEALLQRIRDEDLPKYEGRFKERLNEKVGEEVGLLRSAFEMERTEIEERIDILNQSLKQLEYRDGTHMRLQAQQVRDREIVDFRQAMYECVSDAFDGSTEANEQRYLRIEKLIVRLRDEEPWRRKVTDVRNWFDFAAIEIDELTGEERSYHEDSSGKSGGGKAKLAFTILVAAIAYQYDLQPDDSGGRFRFVMVDEMFSRVDDRNSKYALDLFAKFGLQLLIVAPLDAKARITEPYVGCYLLTVKDANTNRSEVFHLTATQFTEQVAAAMPHDDAANASLNGHRRLTAK